MLVLYLIILMFTNSFNSQQKNIHSIFINRITILIFLVSILLNLNTLYFQSIGKGVSIYNGLFQITLQTQVIELFLLTIGIFILSGWAKKFYLLLSFSNLSTLTSGSLNNNYKLSNIKSSANFSKLVSFFTVTNTSSDSTLLTQTTVNKEVTDNKGVLPFVNSAYDSSYITNLFQRSLEDSREANNIAINRSELYSLIAIFSILGGSLLMSSLDLLSMYLSIELQSFALYVLASLNKDKLSATSAGLKYFLLGGLSSCFILLGSAIIYSYTGLTHFESISSLMSIPSSFISNVEVNYIENFSALSDINKAFSIGLIIIIVGFLFKISAAPFYQWAPDVYESTPTIVTVWLTIVAKLTILIFLQGFIDFPLPDTTFINSLPIISNIGEGFTDTIFNGTVYNTDASAYIIKNLLLISSLLSLIIGTIAGLSQIKIKRLLAFSSVSHVGFLLLALAIYSVKSIESFFFYLIQYSITSLNIFLIILALGYFINKYFLPVSNTLPNKNKIRTSLLSSISKDHTSLSHLYSNKEGNKVWETDLNYISELKGQLTKNTILSFSLAICLFSMAGIPPLIGFFSKQFVLFSSIENGNLFLSFIAILVSVISASYYLKLIKVSFFDLETIKSSLSGEEKTTIENYSADSKVLNETKALNEDNKAKENFFAISLDLSKIHSYMISILTFIILLFFINPSIILNCSSFMALTIFHL